jgi:tetratricopeptide (TPR) repeat protein
LKEAFQGIQGGGGQNRKPVQIVSTRIDRLFPSLLQYYKRNPAASVTVKNILSERAEGVHATLFIKEYMNFPAESEKRVTLNPSEEVSFDLPVVFKSEILSTHTEDLPVQVRISVTYTVGGEEHTVSTYKTATLYKNTALSWDDSRKLAAFITPNEDIVSQFAHRVATSVEDRLDFRFSSAFLRAAALVDAVGAYSIDYIEDPASPITAVLENTEAVDTVRFPRTTLYYRSGDCDDSTALLCSLLESTGIPTAIMTSPGHVFFAFDTGEPASNAWQYRSAECEILDHGGTIWVPVEATVVDKGFFTAWKEASKLVRRYSGSGELEFLPVRKAWELYPALSLPTSSLTIVEPAAERVNRKRADSLASIKNNLYTEIVDTIASRASGDSGPARAKSLNQLGILHARFGEDAKAEELFREALKASPLSISTYVNLANLMLIRDDPERALSFLEEAAEIRPDSV